MQVTTTKLAFRRLGYLVLSGVITGTITWLTGEYSNAIWYPLVYLILTTGRDFLNKELPNK